MQAYIGRQEPSIDPVAFFEPCDRPAYHDRAWWLQESLRQGTDWQTLAEAAATVLADAIPELEEIALLSAENRYLRAQLARFTKPTAAPQPPPTPQVTIEAILLTVRQRGLSALKEPANQERLKRCDAAARQQINNRIEKFKQGAAL
jgi:hypothetical protein